MCATIRQQNSVRATLLMMHLLISMVSAQAVPTAQSKVYSWYNAFVDTSKAGTDNAIQRLTREKQLANLQITSSNTNPSVDDLADFATLEHKFVEFDGNVGLEATRDSINQLKFPTIDLPWHTNYAIAEWSMGVWFRLSGVDIGANLPWQVADNVASEAVKIEKKRKQTILEMQFPDNAGRPDVVLSCQIRNDLGLLQCFSSKINSELKFDLRGLNVKAERWYYLAIDSRVNEHRAHLFSQEWQLLNEVKVVSNGPISIINMHLRLGMSGNLTNSGLKGSLKRFTLTMERLQSSDQHKPFAFSYLYAVSNPKLLIEVSLDGSSPYHGLLDQINMIPLQQFGTGNLTDIVDYSPNWLCFHVDPRDLVPYYRLQGSRNTLKLVTLSALLYKDTNSNQGDYVSSVKMWFYREPLVNTKGEAKVNADGSLSRNDFANSESADHDEILFDHEGVLRLTFKRASTKFLTVTDLGDTTKEIQIEVPRGQWIYLHAEHTENDFTLYVRTYSGRVLRAYSKRVEHANKPNYKTSARVKLASNFYGYVSGVKHFKKKMSFTDPIDYFNEVFNSDRDLMLYYRLEEQYYDAANREFKNLATFTGATHPALSFLGSRTVVGANGQIQVLPIEIHALFDNLPLLSASETTITGDRNSPISWDGVTCSGQHKSLLLLQKTKLWMPIRVNNPRAIQVNLWLQMNVTDRGSSGYSDARLRSNEVAEYDATVFQLKTADSAKLPVMELRIRNTTLTCEIFGHGRFNDQVVVYKDFDFYSQEWQRVSCWFEGIAQTVQNQMSISNDDQYSTKYNVLQGSLFKGNQTFLYYDYTTSASIADRRYQFYRGTPLSFGEQPIILNMTMGGPTNLRSTSDGGIFVQHLRLWDKVQNDSYYDLQMYQQAINIKSTPNLIVYAPLMEGAQYQFKIFNHKNGKAFAVRNATFLDTQSPSKIPKPMLCPPFYSYSFQKNSCIQNIVRPIQEQASSGWLMRGANDANFTFMVDDLIFVEFEGLSFHRRISPYILQYNWHSFKLTNFAADRTAALLTSLQSTERINRLTIGSNDMKPDGVAKMDLSLDVIGKHSANYNAAIMNLKYNLAMNPCAKFFEVQTGKAFVERNLQFERRQHDVSFEFEMFDCASQFYSDVNSPGGFKMYMFYHEDRPYQFELFKRENNKITIPANFFTYVRVNDWFYLIAKALFRSRTTGDSQFLSVVFKMRFVKTIYVDPTIYKVGVPFGGNLTLSTSSAKMINSDVVVPSESLSRTWICPASFDCSKLNETATDIVITDADLPIVSKGVKYMVRYQFIVQLRYKYGLLRDLPYEQRTFNVTWLGPPNNVRLEFQQVNSISKELLIRLTLDNDSWLSQIGIKWTLEGTDAKTNDTVSKINAKSAYLNGDTNIGFIVARNTLMQSGNYTVRLKLYSIDFNNVQIYTSSGQFQMVSAPYGGSLSINKEQGPALFYTYSIQATNWKSFSMQFVGTQQIGGQRLTYQYFYSNEKNTLIPLTAASQDLTSISTILPPTKLISVKVTDSLGGETTMSKAVNIQFQTAASDSQTIYDQFLQQLKMAEMQAETDSLTSFQSLATWTDAMRMVQGNITAAQADALNLKVLEVTSKIVSLVNETMDLDSRDFIAQKTILLQRKLIEQVPTSGLSLPIISQQLKLLTQLSSKMHVAMQNSFRSSQKWIDDTVGLAQILYAGHQNISYGLNATSDANATVKLNSESLRRFFNELDQMLAVSLLDGQSVKYQRDGVYFEQQKFSKIGTARDDWTYQQPGGKLSYIFPMSQMKQPTQSQSFTSIIYTNEPSAAQQAAYLAWLNKTRAEDAAWLKYQQEQGLVAKTATLQNNLTNTLPEPSYWTQGGPFSSAILAKQRVIGNYTFYFTYRDMNGLEVERYDYTNFRDSPKIIIEFKINLTDYIRNKFVADTHYNLRCAYHPSNSTINFEKFQTRKCETALIDEYNQLIYTSLRNFTLFEGGDKIINLTNPDSGVPVITNNSRLIELLANQSTLSVKCLCHHMSYYTLIEDEEARKISFTGPIELPPLPERLNDWYGIAMAAYIISFFLITLVIAQALDSSSWKALKDMEEIEENELENRSPGSKLQAFVQEEESVQDDAERTVSLVNYIFQRKLMIDSYAEGVLPVYGPPIKWSRSCNRSSCSLCCQLYRLFMVRVHPLFSIFSHFDISILRWDRAMWFFTRVNICAIVCHYFLSAYRYTPLNTSLPDNIYEGLTESQIALIPNALQKDEEQQVVEFDKILEDKNARLRQDIYIVLYVSILLLMPWPTWIYSMCRIRFRLLNKLMSILVEEVQLDQQQSARVDDEQHEGGASNGRHAYNSNQFETKDSTRYSARFSARGPNGEKLDSQIFIDPSWPLSTLYRINDLPYEELHKYRALFQYNYAAAEFHGTLDFLQQRIIEGGHVGYVSGRDASSMLPTRLERAIEIELQQRMDDPNGPSEGERPVHGDNSELVIIGTNRSLLDKVLPKKPPHRRADSIDKQVEDKDEVRVMSEEDNEQNVTVNVRESTTANFQSRRKNKPKGPPRQIDEYMEGGESNQRYASQQPEGGVDDLPPRVDNMLDSDVPDDAVQSENLSDILKHAKAPIQRNMRDEATNFFSKNRESTVEGPSDLRKKQVSNESEQFVSNQRPGGPLRYEVNDIDFDDMEHVDSQEVPPNNISYLQDEHGNVIAVEEISANVMHGLVPDLRLENMTHMIEEPPQFIDDKKYLRGKNSCCQAAFARLVVLLVNLFALGLLVLNYYNNKRHLIEGYSSFAMYAFFAVQVFTLFILQPIYFVFLALLFTYAPVCCCGCCCSHYAKSAYKEDWAAEILAQKANKQRDDSETSHAKQQNSTSKMSLTEEDPFEVIRRNKPISIIKSHGRDGSPCSTALAGLMPLCYQLYTDLVEQTDQLRRVRKGDTVKPQQN